jgi:hypothetical protein
MTHDAWPGLGMLHQRGHLQLLLPPDKSKCCDTNKKLNLEKSLLVLTDDGDELTHDVDLEGADTRCNLLNNARRNLAQGKGHQYAGNV